MLALLGAPARAEPLEGLSLRDALAGVLAYTRWPQPPDPLRLCFIGNSPYVESLLREGLPSLQRTLVLHRLPSERLVSGQCDALYVASVAVQDWQRLQAELDGQPILTVCERSDACTAGGMVRLNLDGGSHNVRFEINLDAVARSAVRIHPQVLRLGRRSAREVTP
ncbi:YfiR family protein [Pseudorhodoferax sp.]|uniref:YfiR family protein n=1 Tax=Pseudorhodoferax sp. TaxID=1993553 RepID=UPI0039E5EED7